MQLNIFKKVGLFLLGILAVVATGLAVSLLLFEDQIAHQFIREANKQLNTPIRIGRVDVALWRHFPNVDIVFTDVYVEDSHPGEYPLHTAGEISLSVSAVDLWQRRYRIRRLHIEESETTLKVSETGLNNYTVLKPSEGEGTSISFDLNNVTLVNAKVTYADQGLNQEHIFLSEELHAALKSEDDTYFITAAGDVHTEKIRVGKYQYLAGKSFQVRAQLDFDDRVNEVTFHPSLLELGPARFEVSGNYRFKDRNLIDLRVLGVETDIRTLLSLLPGESAEHLMKYRSEGEVYFDARVEGTLSSVASPAVDVSFGSKGATFFHPEFSSRITEASVEGRYMSPSITDPSKGKLTLAGIEGKLNSFPFRANLHIDQFDHPYVEISFNGTLDAQSLQNFYPLPDLSDFAGTFAIDASLRGEVELLKNKETAQRVRTTGSIEMAGVQFAYGPRKVPVRDLSGTLNFTNNDLALSNVSGSIGRSDFLLNGFFKNIVSYMLFEGQPIGIEADLVSHRMELDELFDMIFGEEESEDYTFSISRNLLMNFNCQVGHLNYGKFNARSLTGDLLIKNQMAVSRNLRFTGMGGEASLSGILDAKNSKAIDLVATARLSGIHLDSLFYVFDDFRQDFITQKHLRGQTEAEISLEATLSPALRIFPETLVADAGVTIRQGELINFEPLKDLKKYLNEEGLDHLFFADLKNDIRIQNKTVYIPQMGVRTNVIALMLSGTHTFDQRIDYRIVAPLRSKSLVMIDQASEAIEEDLKGKMKVFLKITGTADEYKVAYDAVAVKKKIMGDLKKEVKELRDAFRFKGKKAEKEQQLEEEEYFDWEVDPDTVKRPIRAVVPIR